MGMKSRGPASTNRRGKKVDVSAEADAKSRCAKREDDGGDDRRRLFGTLILAVAMPTVLTAVARFVAAAPAFRGGGRGGDRPYFLARLVLSVLLDATYGGAFSVLLLPPARAAARLLPGASVPPDATGCGRQEAEQNDPDLVWPLPGTELPPDWVAAAASSGRGGRQEEQERRRQPYFLNHVRGSTRIRQATYRVAAALGTVLTAVVMSRWVDRTPLADIGLELSPADLARGLLVGAGAVVALFAAEVGLGWLRVVGYGEVVAPGESLPVNLAWDVLFHLGVSVNEEVLMRGWILVNTAKFAAALGASASAAMVLSVSLQAGMFALLHLGSPGASRVGLVNLVVGGTAAALNVFLSGGLSFSLGWHFGWNITMGHLLGLSTSGIPMSAKLVSVVPHPGKAHLHGGRFGPEQSPLAPVAYLLGCAALVVFYGTEGLGVWRERLSSPVAKPS